MSLQWSTTNRAATTNGVKMLVYGPAGAGKTMLAATLPRPAIISAEAGLLSLSRKNLERVWGASHSYVQDIPVLQVTTWEQLVEAYMYFASPTSDARSHVDSVSLDSITEVAEVILSKLKMSKNDPRQAYGEMADRIIGMVKNFRDLPGYNVYVSSKMAYDKDENTGGMKFQPMMPGKQTGPQLPYLFDEVFRLDIGAHENKKYRFLQTDGDAQYVAKDRSGALDSLEPPELSHIIRKIIGG